jgi:hypothetical protein
MFNAYRVISLPLLLVVAFLHPHAVMAQDIKELTVGQTKVFSGMEVPITVEFDVGNSSKYCGLGMQFGDGNSREVRAGLNGDQDFPLKVTHTYANPGIYTISVSGKYVSRGFKSAEACGGTSRQVAVTVVDQASAKAADDLERKQRLLAEREFELRVKADQLERARAQLDIENRRRELEDKERKLAEKEKLLQTQPPQNQQSPSSRPPPTSLASPRRPLDAF